MRNGIARNVVALASAATLSLFAMGCGGASTTEGADAASTEATEATETTEEAGDVAAEQDAPDYAAEVAALADAADQQAASGTIFVQGFEWGPGVSKVIVELPAEAEAVSATDARIVTADAERTITDLYLSDATGEKAEGASKYATFELETTNEVSGSPFTYDFMVTFMNDWSEEYGVEAIFGTTVGGKETTTGINADLIANRICPDVDVFANRGEFKGNYENPMTKEKEDYTLHYAAFEPDTLAKDKAKNPLVIWLHGQGEGGTDPDITLLGNEVVALAKDDIQAHFTTKGGENGAYVLAVQTPTYWMDGGDGTNSNGDVISRYTEVLMDAIKKYVGDHDDVDTNRIYLGGCSNGGYMTMNMLVEYPDYWAAAYPICEAYAFNMYERNADGTYKVDVDDSGFMPVTTHYPTDERWMTDEKIASLKNIPIWFVQSADDTTVAPAQFAQPTYRAMLKAGDTNKWFSLFETVQGTDDSAATYMGHWSWVYLFNDQVTAVQDTKAIADSADDDTTFGFTATNDGGGTAKAGEFSNIFDWLNAQSK